MIFRKTKFEDINDVLKIIDDAKNYFKDNNIDQWQKGYPNKEIIEQDIINKEGYVLIDNDTNIIGTLSLSFRGEPTYKEIYNGKWLTNNDFGVLHRVAVDIKYKGKGLANIMISEAEKIAKSKGFKSLRVDTHENNIPMQRVLNKSNFKRCGNIYLIDGDERIAYEKILK